MSWKNLDLWRIFRFHEEDQEKDEELLLSSGFDMHFGLVGLNE